MSEAGLAALPSPVRRAAGGGRASPGGGPACPSHAQTSAAVPGRRSVLAHGPARGLGQPVLPQRRAAACVVLGAAEGTWGWECLCHTTGSGFDTSPATYQLCDLGQAT